MCVCARMDKHLKQKCYCHLVLFEMRCCCVCLSLFILVWRKGGDLVAPYESLRSGNGDGGAGHFSLIGHEGVAQACAREEFPNIRLDMRKKLFVLRVVCCFTLIGS